MKSQNLALKITYDSHFDMSKIFTDEKSTLDSKNSGFFVSKIDSAIEVEFKRSSLSLG